MTGSVLHAPTSGDRLGSSRLRTSGDLRCPKGLLRGFRRISLVSVTVRPVRIAARRRTPPLAGRVLRGSRRVIDLVGPSCPVVPANLEVVVAQGREDQDCGNDHTPITAQSTISIAEFPSVETFVALSRPSFFERWQLSGCEKSRKWQNLGISFADLAAEVLPKNVLPLCVDAAIRIPQSLRTTSA